MPELAEIVFRSGGKVYSFDTAGLELSVGDDVIVRTSRGMELGKVVVANHEVPETEVVSPLEKIVRLATENDATQAERNEKLAARAQQVCEEKVAEYDLDMRLISTEVVFDGSKIIISFFAEERVDFRKLVEDLAKKFRTRIEFRQVGVRDEARLIGGYGPCGRRMCCTMFAGDQQPVSIRMAKEQNLPLNPMKISGICGRLMCCLKYEQESYREFKGRAPSKGSMVCCERGEGKVVDFCVPKEKIVLDLGEGRQAEISLDEILPPGQRPPEGKPLAQIRPQEKQQPGKQERAARPQRERRDRRRTPRGAKQAAGKAPGSAQGKAQGDGEQPAQAPAQAEAAPAGPAGGTGEEQKEKGRSRSRRRRRR